MKKFAFASLAALALAAISSQPASAWFSFNVGGSANLSIACGGHSKSTCSENWPNTYGSPGFNFYGPAGGVPSAPCCGGYACNGAGYGGTSYASAPARGANYLDLVPVPGAAGLHQADYRQAEYYYWYPAPMYYFYYYGW
jgi:hypothetical protein